MPSVPQPRPPDPHRRHEQRRALRAQQRSADESRGAAAGEPQPAERTWRPLGLALLRYVLPGTIVVAGVVVMAFGSEIDLEGGGAIVSAGLATYFLNWLFRLGVAGDAEREREDAAREYFDRHGRWPS